MMHDKDKRNYSRPLAGVMVMLQIWTPSRGPVNYTKAQNKQKKLNQRHKK